MTHIWLTTPIPCATRIDYYPTEDIIVHVNEPTTILPRWDVVINPSGRIRGHDTSVCIKYLTHPILDSGEYSGSRRYSENTITLVDIIHFYKIRYINAIMNITLGQSGQGIHHESTKAEINKIISVSKVAYFYMIQRKFDVYLDDYNGCILRLLDEDIYNIHSDGEFGKQNCVLKLSYSDNYVISAESMIPRSNNDTSTHQLFDIDFSEIGMNSYYDYCYTAQELQDTLRKIVKYRIHQISHTIPNNNFCECDHNDTKIIKSSHCTITLYEKYFSYDINFDILLARLIMKLALIDFNKDEIMAKIREEMRTGIHID